MGRLLDLRQPALHIEHPSAGTFPSSSLVVVGEVLTPGPHHRRLHPCHVGVGDIESQATEVERQLEMLGVAETTGPSGLFDLGAFERGLIRVGLLAVSELAITAASGMSAISASTDDWTTTRVNSRSGRSLCPAPNKSGIRTRNCWDRDPKRVSPITVSAVSMIGARYPGPSRGKRLLLGFGDEAAREVRTHDQKHRPFKSRHLRN